MRFFFMEDVKAQLYRWRRERVLASLTQMRTVTNAGWQMNKLTLVSDICKIRHHRHQWQEAKERENTVSFGRNGNNHINEA